MGKKMTKRTYRFGSKDPLVRRVMRKLQRTTIKSMAKKMGYKVTTKRQHNG